MDSIYREFSPSPRLAPHVECFWIGEAVSGFSARILPDGCADVLFVARGNELVDVQLVGVMTRPRVVRLAAGTLLLGVRFHPGMAGACLGFDLPTINDRVVPLGSLVGSESNRFAKCFSGHSAVEKKIAAIEDCLTSLPTINCIDSAVGELVASKGQLSLEDFAAAAGVGPRQLRRACLRRTGLAPKTLARVLRFRHAVARLRKRENNMSQIALSCGYYDQAHMVRDFRSLAGISPARYVMNLGP